DVGPTDELGADHHEGLDGDGAATELERAVLREQAAVGASIHADQRPVGLLPDERSRVAPSRRLARERRDESVRARAEGQLLELQLRTRVARRRPLLQRQADEARL